MSFFEIEYDRGPVNGEVTGRLDVLLAYEDFSTGLRARQSFEKVARQLELNAAFKVNLWRFDLLREPGFLERATTEAANADIVFLSAHGRGELPGMAKLWLEHWFERRGAEPCALVVLLDMLAGDTAAVNQVWETLRAAAVAAGVDVFLHAAEAFQTGGQPAADEIRAHPESRPAPPGEALHIVERHSYRHWGINE
jgi:uncharacterized protein YozE (UPF0346 family)